MRIGAEHRTSPWGEGGRNPSEIPGGDDAGARPGDVLTYQLSPEELERYRAMPPPGGRAPIGAWPGKPRKRASETAIETEIRDKALRLLADGAKAKDVAQTLNVSEQTVRNWRKEAEKVTEMQKRIEQLIQEGVSPDEIRKREIVAKATLVATCERLGVEWIGERWESVRRPEDPGEHGNAERAGVGDDGPEKTLQQAINDGIDTGLSPDVIAQQEHCSVSDVLALSQTRALHWHLDKLQWVTFAPPWADARDADGAAPARPEALQDAEAHDVRTRAEKAVALKDLKDLLLALNQVAAGERLDNFQRNVVTEALAECLARREQVLLS